jgi:hypothetical protein
MRHKIDYWGSLMSDRLKFINLTVSDYVNIGLYAFYNSLFLLLIALSTLFLIQGNFKPEASFFIFFLLIMFYLTGLLALYGVIMDNKLKRFSGLDETTNMAIMTTVIGDFFNTHLVYSGDRILTYYRRATFIRFGIRVVVCFQQKEVLINISKFNYFGIKSSFHQPFIDLTTHKIIRDFKNKLGETPMISV